MLAIFAALWLCAGWYVSTTLARERSGAWDRELAAVAQDIVMSMPANISQLSSSANLTLAQEMPRLSSKFDRFGFQVWVKTRRELVVRSPTAPATPLQREFQDGFSTFVIDGEEWRGYAVSDAKNQVQVQVAKPTAEFVAETRKWLRVGLGLSFVVFLILVIAVKLVIRWSLRAVVAVQETILTRDALDLKPLPVADLPEEVRPLVDAVNRLLDKLDRNVRSERQFLAEAAHELRTPLAVLLTHAQVALRSRDPAEARASLEQLVLGCERSARLSQQLLDSARLDVEARAGLQAPLELADVVGVVVDEFAIMAAHKGQAITLDAESATIVGNVDELGILIRNLVDNAVRYTPKGGRVAVCCQRVGDSARLTVCDDGPGVAAVDRDRIFDRFYRVAGSNERGSGIGLSLVARIAQSHGATIATGPGIEGIGFGVTVTFARWQRPAVDEPPAPAVAAPRTEAVEA
ncbi:MAG TPA: ATP-binding protein [Tahibacter sp.]|nr:ATP-binding protein [Tahibacter sp.]